MKGSLRERREGGVARKGSGSALYVRFCAEHNVVMGSDAAAALRAIKTDLTKVRNPARDLRPESMSRLTSLEGRVAQLVGQQSTAELGADHPLRGLYLTQEQAVGLLDRSNMNATGGELTLPNVSTALGDAFQVLADRTGLTARDIDVLVAALAPDVDARFEKLYGFLHDDLTKRRATIGLAMRLCAMHPASLTDRARFASTSPLVSNSLVVIDDDGPFLGRTMRVPDHVVDVLFGGVTVEPILQRLTIEPVRVDASDIGVVRNLLELSTLIHLTEGIGGAAAHIAALAAHDCGRGSLIVDVSAVSADELQPVLDAVVRHQALTGDVVIIRPVDCVAELAPRALVTLTATRGSLVFVGTRSWDPVWAAEVPRHVHIAELPQDELARVWERSLVSSATELGAVDAVRSSFRLTPEQIVRAARAASFAVDNGQQMLSFTELSAGARSQSASGLDRLARRLEPSAGWSDLILPDLVVMMLHELALRVRWREQVMQRWELGRGWRGRGIAALLAGPSGTGKTTAAEVIAAELGYDIHVVDLSSVVDKYIGETEKKLEVIFTEAERTNTVLLFDEADAIFGKRSEVKDARDRYANIEVSYLLQRIERFSGLALLTTNLGANLDEAFTRRLDMVIDFPRPDAEARERLWRHEFRPTVPAEGIDFEFCAGAFDLTGGNIRNIVITAAYLAAESRRAVSMVDVVAAVQREYRKMGRLCLSSEFGRYADLLA